MAREARRTVRALVLAVLLACHFAGTAGRVAPQAWNGGANAGQRRRALASADSVPTPFSVSIECGDEGVSTNPTPLFTLDFGRSLQNKNPLALFNIEGANRVDIAYSKDAGKMWVLAFTHNVSLPGEIRLSVDSGVAKAADSGAVNTAASVAVSYVPPATGGETFGKVAGWGVAGSLALSLSAAALSPAGVVGVGAINAAGFAQTFAMSGKLPITNMPANYRSAAESVSWIQLQPAVGPLSAAPSAQEQAAAAELADPANRFPTVPVEISAPPTTPDAPEVGAGGKHPVTVKPLPIEDLVDNNGVVYTPFDPPMGVVLPPGAPQVIANQDDHSLDPIRQQAALAVPGTGASLEQQQQQQQPVGGENGVVVDVPITDAGAEVVTSTDGSSSSDNSGAPQETPTGVSNPGIVEEKTPTQGGGGTGGVPGEEPTTPQQPGGDEAESPPTDVQSGSEGEAPEIELPGVDDSSPSTPSAPAQPGTETPVPGTPTDVQSGKEGEMPEVELPEVEAPEVEAPEVESPEVEPPEVEAPEVEAPETEQPETEQPEVEAPEPDEPEVPEVELPETELPPTDVQSGEETDSPEIELPSVPSPSPETSSSGLTKEEKEAMKAAEDALKAQEDALKEEKKLPAADQAALQEQQDALKKEEDALKDANKAALEITPADDGSTAAEDAAADAENEATKAAKDAAADAENEAAKAAKDAAADAENEAAKAAKDVAADAENEAAKAAKDVAADAENEAAKAAKDAAADAENEASTAAKDAAADAENEAAKTAKDAAKAAEDAASRVDDTATPGEDAPKEIVPEVEVEDSAADPLVLPEEPAKVEPASGSEPVVEDSVPGDTLPATGSEPVELAAEESSSSSSTEEAEVPGRRLLVTDPLQALSSSGFSYVVVTVEAENSAGHNATQAQQDGAAVGASALSRIRTMQAVADDPDADARRLRALWSVLFWSAILIVGVLLLHLLVLGLLRWTSKTVPKMLHLPRLELLVFMMTLPMIAAAGAALLRSDSAGALTVGVLFAVVLPFGFLAAASVFLVLYLLRHSVEQRRALYIVVTTRDAYSELEEQLGGAPATPARNQPGPSNADIVSAFQVSSSGSPQAQTFDNPLSLRMQYSPPATAASGSSSSSPAAGCTALLDRSLESSLEPALSHCRVTSDGQTPATRGLEQRRKAGVMGVLDAVWDHAYRWLLRPLFGFPARDAAAIAESREEPAWMGRGKADGALVKRYGCFFEDAHGPQVLRVESRFNPTAVTIAEAERQEEVVGAGVLLSATNGGAEGAMQALQTFGIVFAVTKMVLFAVVINAPGGVNSLAQVLALVLVALMHVIYLRVCRPYRLRVELAAEVVASVCDMATFACGVVLIAKDSWTADEKTGMGIAMLALQAVGFLIFISVRVALALRTVFLTVGPALKELCCCRAPPPATV